MNQHSACHPLGYISVNSSICRSFFTIIMWFFCVEINLMRLIDRLYQYINYLAISAYAFEHQCELSNGYLGKQFKGKGTIGSGVLNKIESYFPDLNIQWLVSGKGKMIRYGMELYAQEPIAGSVDEYIIQSLQNQVAVLQQAIKDKNAIICLLKKEKIGYKNALLKGHS